MNFNIFLVLFIIIHIRYQVEPVIYVQQGLNNRSLTCLLKEKIKIRVLLKKIKYTDQQL